MIKTDDRHLKKEERGGHKMILERSRAIDQEIVMIASEYQLEFGDYKFIG